MGAGHSHAADGPYQEKVDRALKWLLMRQGLAGTVSNLNSGLGISGASVRLVMPHGDTIEVQTDLTGQFQKGSEGRTFVAEFTLTSRQLTGSVEPAELVMPAKGAQLQNRVGHERFGL